MKPTNVEDAVAAVMEHRAEARRESAYAIILDSANEILSMRSRGCTWTEIAWFLNSGEPKIVISATSLRTIFNRHQRSLSAPEVGREPDRSPERAPAPKVAPEPEQKRNNTGTGTEHGWFVEAGPVRQAPEAAPPIVAPAPGHDANGFLLDIPPDQL